MFSSSLPHSPSPSAPSSYCLPTFLYYSVLPLSLTSTFLSQSSPSLRSLSLSSLETLVRNIPCFLSLIFKMSPPSAALVPPASRNTLPSGAAPSLSHRPAEARRTQLARCVGALGVTACVARGGRASEGAAGSSGSPAAPARGASWGNMAASGLPPGPARAWPRPLPVALRPPFLQPGSRGGRCRLSLPLPPPRHGEELELRESWLPAGSSTATQRGFPVQVTGTPRALPSVGGGWRGAGASLDGAPARRFWF